jgi:SRSO17 transposase
VNTVYRSYATTRGHALVGARIWVPAAQLDDEVRRTELGISADVGFRTKPQLAKELVADMVADHTMPLVRW